jgi:hypothetical protein
MSESCLSLKTVIATSAMTAAGLGTTALADTDLGAATAEAQRYADCLVASDTRCIYELTHPLARIQAIGGVDGYWSLAQSSILQAAAEEHLPVYRNTGWTLEIGAAASLDYASDLQFAIVPYRQTVYAGSLTERRGFMLGVSDDNQHWCFIEDTAFALRGVKRILPRYEGPPLPEMSMSTEEAPGRVRSDYLDTTLGAFTILGSEGDAHYELSFEVRKRIRDELPLVIVYENPRDAEAPYIVRSSLAAKQDELRVTSPLITGFERGQIYRVVVFAIDTATEDVLFEHHQLLVFQPMDGLVEQFMPAVARIPGQSFALPAGVFPPGWYERNINAGIGDLCPAAETGDEQQRKPAQ